MATHGSGLLRILTLALTAICLVRGQGPDDDVFHARDFIDACRAQNESTACTSYRCFAQSANLDLRTMDQLHCATDDDCLSSVTGLSCVKDKDLRSSFCECPHFSAFNMSSCACQQAKLCLAVVSETRATPLLGVTAGDSSGCYSGMACVDQKCSCGDLRRTLFEPLGRFCVLPGGPGDVAGGDALGSDSTGRGFLIALCVIGSLVALAVLAIAAYMLIGGLACSKGDYECDSPSAKQFEQSNLARSQSHVAAWNLPSLDYLSEEHTLKYIRQQQPTRPDSRASGEVSVTMHSPPGNGAARVNRDSQSSHSSTSEEPTTVATTSHKAPASSHSSVSSGKPTVPTISRAVAASTGDIPSASATKRKMTSSLGDITAGMTFSEARAPSRAETASIGRTSHFESVNEAFEHDDHKNISSQSSDLNEQYV
jgi:hypothetical protein